MKMLANIAAVAIFITASAARGEDIKLTMKEAVKMAIERNLDLRTEIYNAAIAKEDVRKYKGIYGTLLNLSVNYQNSTTVPAVIGSTGKQNTLKINPAITQLVPTGGNVGIQFNNSRTVTDYAFSTLPEYWQSDVTLLVSQPLLRNFGSDATNLNIKVAEQAKEAEIRKLATKIQAVIAQTRIDYFKLQSFREDLQSKKVSLDYSKLFLNDVSERVKAGVLPQIEVLNAEFGVSSREKELIDAEKALKDQVDLLRKELQLPATADLFAVEVPSLDRIIIDENDAVHRAINLRPEIEEAKIQITSAEIQRTAARNKTLPALNLNGSFALTGLAADYGQNLDRLSSRDFPVWSVGFQFEYPLGNDAAEAEFAKSRLRVDQTKNQLESLISDVTTEVRAAVRAVDASYKQLDVAARGRAFAEERLKAYVSKAEVGLATTKEVVDMENDLAKARTDQIKAQVTYMASVTQFFQATGQLLNQERVTVNGKTIEQLLGRR